VSQGQGQVVGGRRGRIEVLINLLSHPTRTFTGDKREKGLRGKSVGNLKEKRCENLLQVPSANGR